MLLLCFGVFFFFFVCVVVFQAEDGIRDLVRSRGLGDVYKRQNFNSARLGESLPSGNQGLAKTVHRRSMRLRSLWICLLYTSDAADERSSVDLGGRRIIKKKKQQAHMDS